MVARAFNPSPTLERQRQADFWVQGQPGLHSEFQDSQNYTEKPCLEEKTNEQTKNKNKQPNKQTNKKTGFVLHVLVFFLHVWMFSTCLPGVQEGQMEFSGFWKLELQIISSHHVGVQNRVLIGAHYCGANSLAHVPLLISSWANHSGHIKPDTLSVFCQPKATSPSDPPISVCL